MVKLQEKIFVGHKLRRLSQSMELLQTAMSEILDISLSYQNLPERNQRSFTLRFCRTMARALMLTQKILPPITALP
tara:strand:+ start:473 stop:700 length:228 start_codon:yes stop_codon:yes gene_type:complete